MKNRRFNFEPSFKKEVIDYADKKGIHADDLIQRAVRFVIYNEIDIHFDLALFMERWKKKKGLKGISGAKEYSEMLHDLKLKTRGKRGKLKRTTATKHGECKE